MLRVVTAFVLIAVVPVRAPGASVVITRQDDPSPTPKICRTGTLTLPQDCSLRGAIDVVQDNDSLDRDIPIPPGTYPLTQGLLLLSDNVKLVGAGAATTTIDALHQDLAILVLFDHTAEISGVTIMNGQTPSLQDGGGVLNFGTLTMTDCVVRDNFSGGRGGGIANDKDAALSHQGKLTLVRTAIVGNKSMGGGGIFNDEGDLTATDCTIDGNEASISAPGITSSGPGNGVWTTGVATFTRCTISNNKEGAGGGGIAVTNQNSTLTLLNSTVSGNDARFGSGGGISLEAGASVNLESVTIANNTANFRGGGIDAVNGSVTMQNTIIAGNHASPTKGQDCDGTLGSQGFNLVEDVAFCTVGNAVNDVLGEPPLLAPLADNGGRTQTHALLPGSPAINAGNPAVPGGGGTACPPFDQRGVGRPTGGPCDIGAFEFEPATTTTTLPPPELCGDCVDNDSDGRTDFEDPACCTTTAGLSLRPSRFTPRKGTATLVLKGTLAGLALRAGARPTEDVVIQLRGADTPDFLCARVPAANQVRKGKKDSFRDRKHKVTSAQGLGLVTVKERKGTLVLDVSGSMLPLPPAGMLEVTVGLRDPATAEAGNRCGTATASLKAARKGVLRFP
jgi:hypothetical protein